MRHGKMARQRYGRGHGTCIIGIAANLFKFTNQVFGARKINSVLRSRGFKVADKTVAAIMHENGWFSVRGGSKTIFEMNKQRKENILNQQFIANAPNEVWVGDITYFSCNSTKYFICVIIDLFACKVIAHSISTSNSTHITKKTLKKAYQERAPKEGLIFHSDLGSNYTSRTFMSYCKTLDITQSFSRKGVPFDNSVMEAFFKTLKAEELYRNNYRSDREFREHIQKYIDFYNGQRPHQMNRYRTPNDAETSYYKKHAQNNDNSSV